MEKSNNWDMAPRQETDFVKQHQFKSLYLYVSAHKCEQFFMMKKIPMQSFNASVSKKSNVMVYKGQNDREDKSIFYKHVKKNNCIWNLERN